MSTKSAKYVVFQAIIDACKLWHFSSTDLL